MSIKINYEYSLSESVFISRPNRFLLECRFPDGKTAHVHLPDPGRLRELLIPGRKIWVSPVNKANRKTKWSAALCETPDSKSLVSLNSTLPNYLIKKALTAQAMEEFSGYELTKAEYTMRGSRWDFLLTKTNGTKLLTEVKSVTLVEGNTAYFPDAITARGTKHVKELTAIAQEKGWEAAVLFVLQRNDADSIHAAEWIDKKFAEAISAGKKNGVKILGRKCVVTLTHIALGDIIPAG